MILISITLLIGIVALIISLCVVDATKGEGEYECRHFANVIKFYIESIHKFSSSLFLAHCLTPGCLNAALLILDKIDESVAPCDDFYNFTCGNFMKKTSIPDEKDSISTFSKIEDQLQEQLRSLISSKINANDSAPFNMAKHLYKACMNETLIEDLGLKQLVTIMDYVGGWPVLKIGDDGWAVRSHLWSWTWAVKKFREFGYSSDYMFSFSIENDYQNPTSRIIYVSFV